MNYHKELSEPAVNREGYISNHVVSIQLSGEQHIRTYDDKLIKVKPNEVLFIPRGMYLVSDLIPESGKFQNLLFYFDDSIIQELLSNSKVKEVSNKAVPDHLKFGGAPTLRLFAESLINIYQTNRLRNKNFDKPLKIEDYAYLTGRSLSTFRRDFKSYYNITPQKWLKERRLEKALVLLEEKEASVTELAFEVGYENITYFIKEFSNQFGQTPNTTLLL